MGTLFKCEEHLHTSEEAMYQSWFDHVNDEAVRQLGEIESLGSQIRGMA